MAHKASEIFTVKEISDLLTPVFTNYGIKRAVLFGSYSKNSATPKSDIDLCVDSGLRGLKFVSFMESVKNAVGGKDVDIFDVSHIEKNSMVEEEIGRTGVEIYAK